MVTDGAVVALVRILTAAFFLDKTLYKYTSFYISLIYFLVYRRLDQRSQQRRGLGGSALFSLAYQLP